MADVITFGALEPCPKCKNGNFIMAASAYMCHGNLSEWAKCSNVQRLPARRAVEIPSSLKTEHSFLATKRKVQTRALKPAVIIAPKAIKKDEVDGVEGPRVIREKPPLYNMEFAIIGKLEQSKDDVKLKIQRMGGKLGSKIHEKLAAIISTEEEVTRMGSRMNEAKDFGIQVVPEEFLETVKSGGAISYITSKSICDWGTDVSIPSMNYFGLSILNELMIHVLAQRTHTSRGFNQVPQIKEHLHQIGSEIDEFETER